MRYTNPRLFYFTLLYFTAAGPRASTLDDVYTIVGECGKFQRRIVVVIAFISFSTAFNNLGYVFWAARPDFHCVPDDGVVALIASAADGRRNLTISDELLLNLTVPWESSTDEQYHRSR